MDNASWLINSQDGQNKLVKQAAARPVPTCQNALKLFCRRLRGTHIRWERHPPKLARSKTNVIYDDPRFRWEVTPVFDPRESHDTSVLSIEHNQRIELEGVAPSVLATLGQPRKTRREKGKVVEEVAGPSLQQTQCADPRLNSLLQRRHRPTIIHHVLW